MTEWHRFTEFDYAHAILGGSTIPDADPVAQWTTLRSGGLTKIPTPDEIRQFLEQHGFMTPERRACLEDYEYYRAHKSYRRPDVARQR